jgi:hypothetical protein
MNYEEMSFQELKKLYEGIDNLLKNIEEVKDAINRRRDDEGPNPETKKSAIKYPTQDIFKSAAIAAIKWGDRFKVVFTYSPNFGDVHWSVVPLRQKLTEYDIADFAGDWKGSIHEMELHMKKTIMDKISNAKEND